MSLARPILFLLVLLAGLAPAWAQEFGPAPAAPLVPFKLNLGLEAAQQPQDADAAVKILFAITLLHCAVGARQRRQALGRLQHRPLSK